MESNSYCLAKHNRYVHVWPSRQSVCAQIILCQSLSTKEIFSNLIRLPTFQHTADFGFVSCSDRIFLMLFVCVYDFWKIQYVLPCWLDGRILLRTNFYLQRKKTNTHFKIKTGVKFQNLEECKALCEEWYYRKLNLFSQVAEQIQFI